MKAKVEKSFLCLAIFLIVNISIYAQSVPTASATGHITAEIIPVFTASETSQMNFGKFSPGPQGGQLILTPQGSVSVLGSVYSANSLHNAASFYLTGHDGSTFNITLPSNPVILTHITTGKTMLVDNWTSSPSPGIGTGILKDGFQVVYVGASLKVGTLSDNPIGAYAGTYEITFEFN
jgi:hypothetical protein